MLIKNTCQLRLKNIKGKEEDDTEHLLSPTNRFARSYSVKGQNYAVESLTLSNFLITPDPTNDMEA